jgi:formylglycine-generating enzyme required for sulfatase activity
MGSAETEGRIDERPARQVVLERYYIAAHEVTAAQYCKFLDEQGPAGKDGVPRVNLSLADCPIICVDKKFRPRDEMADRPMTCVSWNGAQDYAKWAGGRLPTSAEWEKAAVLAVNNPSEDYLTLLTRKSSVPVQIASPAAAGVTGLIGNVWEWCSDWYARDYYSVGPPNSPLGPSLGDEKVIRGGSWASSEASRRIQNVHSAPPQGYYRTVGFRVVKD